MLHNLALPDQPTRAPFNRRSNAFADAWRGLFVDAPAPAGGGGAPAAPAAAAAPAPAPEAKPAAPAPEAKPAAAAAAAAPAPEAKKDDIIAAVEPAKASADDMRKYLVEKGGKDEDVKKLSDADLEKQFTEAKAKEQPAAKPGEVKVEDIKVTVPEGIEIDEKLMGDFKGLIADAKLSPQERAQKLVDLHASALKAAADKQFSRYGRITFADWARRMDDDGKVATIINLLSQSNEVLKDMLVIEANQATSTRPPCARASERDLAPAELRRLADEEHDRPGGRQLRQPRDLQHDRQGHRGPERQHRRVPPVGRPGLPRGHEPADGWACSSTATPRSTRSASWASRRATTRDDGDRADRGERDRRRRHVGATNTSIWVWSGARTRWHGFFPKGKISGLQHRDLGEWTVYDANNNPYQAYRTHFKWELGLTVRDWRYAVRIANIDVTLQTGRTRRT
jgi:hypothetical protein